MEAAPADDERLRRWRMVLGAEGAEGTGRTLTGRDEAMDGALTALYDEGRKPAGRSGAERAGGLGASAPSVVRWLGDIRAYFPASVVQVMQRDAMDRLGLSELLLEPEMLESLEPDVHLVGTLLSLAKAMPETTKETARAVVRRVVEDWSDGSPPVPGRRSPVPWTVRRGSAGHVPATSTGTARSGPTSGTTCPSPDGRGPARWCPSASSGTGVRTGR